MLEIVSAFVFREVVEDSAAEFPELVDSPCSSVSEQFLQLRECQLDRIQIGRVRWQVTQLGTGRFNGFADTCDLVAGEIVHHHDVPRLQHRSQMLLDPTEEQRAGNGAIDCERSDESLRTQGTQEGRGLPAAKGNFFNQSCAETRTAVAACHVRFGPCFVNKHNFGGIDQFL